MSDSRLDRKPLRLPGYDYSLAGGYFITICTYRRELSLGEIRHSQPQLSALGRLAEQTWRRLPQWYPAVALDACVLMPNHIHGILLLLPQIADPTAETPLCGSSASPAAGQNTIAPSLLSIARSFKGAVSREWNRQRDPATQVWQRGFYDHVIRDEQALYRIREYIAWNPAQWHMDHENDAKSAINPFYAWLEEQGRFKLP